MCIMPDGSEHAETVDVSHGLRAPVFATKAPLASLRRLIISTGTLFAWTIVAGAGAVGAQQDQEAPQTIEADRSARKLQEPSQHLVDEAYSQHLVDEAYSKTKTARTSEEFSHVIKLCKQAMLAELTPIRSKYNKRLLAWAHNMRGEVFADQASEIDDAGDTNRAIELDAKALRDFESAVLLDPSGWKPYHNRGVSYALLGRYDQALVDFNKAIKTNPGFFKAWFNRGEIHYYHEDYEQAVKDYTEVIRLKQDDAKAYSGRANARYSLRQFREALEDFSRAVELDGSNALVFTDRADAHNHLGNWGRAAADYRQAINLDNALGRAYQGAAWLMATCPDQRFRDASRALQAAERAVELDGGGDYRYLDTMAAAYAANGNYEKAVTYVTDAIELAPESEIKALKNRKTLYTQNQPFQQASRSNRGTRR